MALAPAPQLAAVFQVLYQATLLARMMGWHGSETGLTSAQADQLADLMDAVHNLPGLAQSWERCDEALLRGMLRDYDTRWQAGLLTIYDETVAKG